MKYLDCPTLARISCFLDQVDVGDSVVHGDLCAYSCKLAGLDKKLSRSLDQEYQFGSPVSSSPVGPLTNSNSRKTLINLILTLNNTYPDYDFSVLRAQNFRKEKGVEVVEETLESNLQEVSKVWDSTPDMCDKPLVESLWTAIDEVIKLKGCDVYSYKTDVDSDLFADDGVLWSFNYFFCNKRERKIVFLSCRGISKSRKRGQIDTQYDSDGSTSEVDYGMANEMDI